jgi:hypothetical protein
MAKSFRAAVVQLLQLHGESSSIQLVTYFHPDEILSHSGIKTFIRNLQTIAREAEQRGYELVPVTLSEAASVATPLPH